MIITRKKYQQEFFSAKCFAPDCDAKLFAVDVIMHIGYGIALKISRGPDDFYYGSST